MRSRLCLFSPFHGLFIERVRVLLQSLEILHALELLPRLRHRIKSRLLKNCQAAEFLQKLLVAQFRRRCAHSRLEQCSGGKFFLFLARSFVLTNMMMLLFMPNLTTRDTRTVVKVRLCIMLWAAVLT